MHEALQEEIQLGSPTCHTDSEISLCWIHNTGKQWKQFVENHVAEIRRLVSPEHWKHCPSVWNRGVTSAIFKRKMSFWLNGPAYDQLVDDTTETHPTGMS